MVMSSNINFHTESVVNYSLMKGGSNQKKNKKLHAKNLLRILLDWSPDRISSKYVKIKINKHFCKIASENEKPKGTQIRYWSHTGYNYGINKVTELLTYEIMVLLNEAAILAEVLQLHPGPMKADTLCVSWYTIACRVFSSSQSVSFQINVTFWPGNKSDLRFISSTAMLMADA